MYLCGKNWIKHTAFTPSSASLLLEDFSIAVEIVFFYSNHWCLNTTKRVWWTKVNDGKHSFSLTLSIHTWALRGKWKVFKFLKKVGALTLDLTFDCQDTPKNSRKPTYVELISKDIHAYCEFEKCVNKCSVLSFSAQHIMNWIFYQNERTRNRRKRRR